MTDWKKLAPLLAPDIPEDAADRAAAAVAKLEEIFIPRARTIPLDTDPACMPQVEPEPEP